MEIILFILGYFLIGSAALGIMVRCLSIQESDISLPVIFFWPIAMFIASCFGLYDICAGDDSRGN